LSSAARSFATLTATPRTYTFGRALEPGRWRICVV